MSLIVAIAIGLAFCRVEAIQIFEPNWTPQPEGDVQEFRVINPPWVKTPKSVTDAAWRLTACVLAPSTLTTLGLGWIRLPTRRRRELARRPGSVACLAATAALLIGAWFALAFMRFLGA